MPRFDSPADPRDGLPLTPLSLAILLALAQEDRHGYAILKDVEEQTGGTLRVGTGSLYTALQRMVEAGWIEDSREAPAPDEDQRRKYYRLTERGRAVSRAELARLAEVLEVARARRLVPALRPSEGA